MNPQLLYIKVLKITRKTGGKLLDLYHNKCS